MEAGPVFWLPGHPARRAFPSCLTVASIRRRSPVTAAGPQRIFTAFPRSGSERFPAHPQNMGMYLLKQEKTSVASPHIIIFPEKGNILNNGFF